MLPPTIAVGPVGNLNPVKNQYCHHHHVYSTDRCQCIQYSRGRHPPPPPHFRCPPPPFHCPPPPFYPPPPLCPPPFCPPSCPPPRPPPRQFFLRKSNAHAYTLDWIKNVMNRRTMDKAFLGVENTNTTQIYLNLTIIHHPTTRIYARLPLLCALRARDNYPDFQCGLKAPKAGRAKVQLA